MRISGKIIYKLTIAHRDEYHTTCLYLSTAMFMIWYNEPCKIAVDWYKQGSHPIGFHELLYRSEIWQACRQLMPNFKPMIYSNYQSFLDCENWRFILFYFFFHILKRALSDIIEINRAIDILSHATVSSWCFCRKKTKHVALRFLAFMAPTGDQMINRNHDSQRN